MSKIKLFSKEQEQYIRENYKNFPPRVLAKQLGVNRPNLCSFLSRNGLVSNGERRYYKQQKRRVAEGCFDVMEKENWLIG